MSSNVHNKWLYLSTTIIYVLYNEVERDDNNNDCLAQLRNALKSTREREKERSAKIGCIGIFLIYPSNRHLISLTLWLPLLSSNSLTFFSHCNNLALMQALCFPLSFA